MIEPKSDNPNIISIDDEASDAGYFYIIVLLDGDEGDYVSIDLDDEHGDIGQFVIKAGGDSYLIQTLENWTTMLMTNRLE